MKKAKYILILIICIICLIFIISIFNINSKKTKTNDLEILKQYFDEYSSVQIFLKQDSTKKQADDLINKLNDLKYLKNIKYIPKEESYEKLNDLLDDLIDEKIQYSSIQNKIKTGIYYLDDINKLAENEYFEKIKNEILNLDNENIIESISTSGIIENYKMYGMEGVNEYINKCKKN